MARRHADINLRPALLVFLILTAVTGLAFPALLLGVAGALFPVAAHGSLIRRNDAIVGSKWVGQAFDAPRYFWSRPSATAPDPYNAASSGGSNLGPLHPDLMKVPKSRLAALGAAAEPVPIDLLTTSGSGLDPHISVAGALYQVPRVAQARALAPERVRELVEAHTESPTFGFLGEARVNVLELNLALDELR